MITIKHDGCIFCVGCSSVCPVNAIEARGTRMKHYPDKCIDCGLCVKICPANVIQLYKGVKRLEDLPAEAKISKRA
ncbi:MAG: 4Fe-4S dicluster domain-containing protein [Candidatus ainarchaeum sp.]|nr:4Fe-4S dicluster domain-containing protein [Candidatus ainarchaeum sp.]